MTLRVLALPKRQCGLRMRSPVEAPPRAIAGMVENKVQLEVFEGPLDLLLYLVRKEEVDIYQVNLTKLATQFIEYIEVMRQLDLEVAGDFLVMAATLMYIKSRELLPVDKQAPAEEEDEGDDPRWELIRKLVEYKKFKDTAAQLQEKESEQEKVFPRQPGKIEFESQAPTPKPEVSLFDLINAVSAILKRFQQREQSSDVFEDKWTVSEKIEHLAQLLNERTRLGFSELFSGTTSRSEVVVTFLALLELMRLKMVTVTQPEPFSEIEIHAVRPDAAQAPTPSNGALPPLESRNPDHKD
jgi:segregation and condensation protein A